MAEQLVGTVQSVIGPVVDFRFSAGELPEISPSELWETLDLVRRIAPAARVSGSRLGGWSSGSRR